MSHTAEDIALLALARARQHVSEVNESRALIYSRIGIRQQELFALAAKINPDYFGVCAHAPVSDGMVNLATIADPVPTPEMIQRIDIYAPGTSDYAAGDEVNPVTLHDQGASWPPRVVMRNKVLYGVGVDLDGVSQVRIYYSKIPAAILPTGAATEVEMPEPYHMLLVVDAERDLYRRSQKDAAPFVALADAAEAPLLEAFTAHVSAYAGSLQTRFATQTTPAAP